MPNVIQSSNTLIQMLIENLYNEKSDDEKKNSRKMENYENKL